MVSRSLLLSVKGYLDMPMQDVKDAMIRQLEADGVAFHERTEQDKDSFFASVKTLEPTAIVRIGALGWKDNEPVIAFDSGAQLGSVKPVEMRSFMEDLKATGFQGHFIVSGADPDVARILSLWPGLTPISYSPDDYAGNHDAGHHTKVLDDAMGRDGHRYYSILSGSSADVASPIWTVPETVEPEGAKVVPAPRFEFPLTLRDQADWRTVDYREGVQGAPLLGSFWVTSLVRPTSRGRQVWVDTRRNERTGSQFPWPTGRAAKGWLLGALGGKMLLHLNAGAPLTDQNGDDDWGKHGWVGRNFVADRAAMLPHKWQTYTAVVDRSNATATRVQLYVDGVLELEKSVPKPLSHVLATVDFAPDQLLLGESADAFTETDKPSIDFDGELATVLFEPGLLTAEQAGALHYALIEKVQQGVVAGAQPSDGEPVDKEPVPGSSPVEVTQANIPETAVATPDPVEESVVKPAENYWLTHEEPIAISHEGVAPDDKDEKPRITLAGFEKAYDLGFRHMETDLRLLSSGKLVALHETLGNVEDNDVTGDEPTAAELLSAPTLPGVCWNFELKGDDGTAAKILARELEDPNVQRRVLISFGTLRDTDAITEIRRVLPAGVAFAATVRERSFDWDKLPGWLDGDGYDIDRVGVTQVMHEMMPGAGRLFVDDHDVQVAHGRQLKIHTYDVLGFRTSANDVHYLLDRKVDGIITDDHETVAEVFRNRKLWEPDRGTSTEE